MAEWGSFGATEESATTRVKRAKQRDSHTEDDADQHSPAQEACLLTHRGGQGLGAEAPAPEVRSQGEEWGWLREHSLKGASAPQLGGSPGKSLELPNRQETFSSLFVSWCARRGD